MNEKGYSLVSLTLLLPFVAILSFSTFWILWFVFKKQDFKKVCQYHTLKTQEILVESNDLLISLNQQAWALIIQKKALQKAVEATPPPYNLAVIAKLNAVIAQQGTLRLTQRSILYSANLRARALAYKLRTLLIKKSLAMARFWRQTPALPKINLNWATSKVDAQFKEIAPPYKRGNRHESNQNISASWVLRLQDILPLWIKTFVPVHKTWSGQCASHPHQRSFQWSAAIGKGNHF